MTDVTEQRAVASRVLQPALHQLAVLVAAPATVLSAPDGQLAGGVQGWYVADVRRLARLEVSVAGSDLELVRAETDDAGRHRFGYVARGLGDPIPDPTVFLDRVRELRAGELRETLSLTSTAQRPVDVEVHLDAQPDDTPVARVKTGAAEPSGAPRRRSWRLRLERGETRSVTERFEAEAATGFETAGWKPEIAVEADDPDLERTVRQAVGDLAGLMLREGEDRFPAAGSPWFLTLFGRDSLWTARLLAPFDPDLVLSTLRVLARRQGERDDPATEEEPGRILHEVRSPDLDHSLPPLYYGSIDATSLFVCALADADDWGADADQVRSLLPAARRCLSWQLSASAGSGWLRYVDRSGRGLANQGWKDSEDSVQYADGRLAQAPIALCEVQAYAYEAAVRGAALLARYGEPEVHGLEAWAGDLRERFNDRFWVGHVAIALDRDDRPVDSVTSNMGHVLGTGILDADRARQIARLLAGPELASGHGVRTLTSHSPRYSPLSYHGGSVWPHDTAIAVRGLAAEGLHEEAGRLARDLLGTAPAFAHRLPELFGGDTPPSAYPAACRPQAWAAAAPLAVLAAAAGLRAGRDGPVVADRVDPVLGAYTLSGLRHGERRLRLEVARDGRVILTSR
ncbi:glycogen debranching N-terminal domain-containing protein [Nocardioides mangrovicus]|uniref:glycogen debranching N-terminal domain-containing protein n=1 Tax=Nocardioides mangrovicus TaxID=2478913 RepID=UPI0018E0B53A|nr:glycogen debranching N-terminal domain-containing protein [Nocardioides mangrovicus]